MIIPDEPYRFTVRLSDIYGGEPSDTTKLGTLKGWEYVAFRPPVGGEYYCNKYSGEVEVTEFTYTFDTPRVIVRPAKDWSKETCTQTISATDVYGSIWHIPDGWKIIAFRLPGNDEPFLNILGNSQTKSIYSASASGPRFILERV